MSNFVRDLVTSVSLHNEKGEYINPHMLSSIMRILQDYNQLGYKDNGYLEDQLADLIEDYFGW